jgi:hypothetical protein
MVWLPIVISITALCVSLLTFIVSYRITVTNVTHSLHSKLFEDSENYKILYRNEERNQKYYFDSRSRGAPGNFVGSDEEPRIDIFLERLNFVCMWLLRVRSTWLLKSWSVDEEMLFKQYIQKLYQEKFYQEYFTFLDRSESVRRSGLPYYPFIHKYAASHLGLPRANAPVPGPPEPRAI